MHKIYAVFAKFAKIRCMQKFDVLKYLATRFVSIEKYEDLVNVPSVKHSYRQQIEVRAKNI